ncbi:MAG TPA: endonuclease domain-containing protein, partial [Thermoanaerobaculia bacterium]|nr:endonuclease domain-containing protein [Thermoanaerobaculia bacterium]
HQPRHVPRTLERALRQNATLAEQRLWSALRRSRGFKFRRQHRIGKCVVDFYCAEVRLAIEVDGSFHERRREEDSARDRSLRRLGVHVIRFRNEAVLEGLPVVVAAIEEVCAMLL